MNMRQVFSALLLPAAFLLHNTVTAGQPFDPRVLERGRYLVVSAAATTATRRARHRERPETAGRHDIYLFAHKRLRAFLSDVLLSVGRMDAEDGADRAQTLDTVRTTEHPWRTAVTTTPQKC